MINSNSFDIKWFLSRFGALLALLILVIVIGSIRPEFRTIGNFISILRQSSINGLIAFGMTGVILLGAIDLSVGSILALSSMLCAAMLASGVSLWIAIPVTLLLGITMGFINGTFVTLGKLQPFIATLVTMTIFRGFALIFSGGRPISNLGNSEFLFWLGRGAFLGIPIPVWVLGIAFGLYFFILNMTTMGRQIYATGSNASAAMLAGVKVNKVKVMVYGISGLLASMSGIILLSRLGSAQPISGVGYELDAIAAVVLGGTSMNGGRGRIYGTLLGILIIAVMNNGMNIIGVSSYFQSVLKGLVILLAVLPDRSR